MLRILRNVLLTLLFVAVAVYTVARFIDLLAVRRLEAKVREQGHPLTVGELAATRPVVPDDKNGANALLDIWQNEQPEYWEAFRQGLNPESARAVPQYPPELPYLGSRQLRFSPGQQLTPASLEALEGYLRTNSHRLAAIRDALRAVQYQFPIDFEETYSALLPHLPQLKTAAQTFRLEALLAAHSGDVPAALGAIQHVLLVGNTLSEEPLLLSQLVRFACIASALLGAEDLLCRQALSSEQLDALQKLFEPLNAKKMLRLAMLSERVMCLSAYDHLDQLATQISDDSERPSPADVKKGMAFFSFVGLRVIERRTMLEVMEEAVALAEDTSPEAFRRAVRLDDFVAAKVRGFPPKIFCSLLLPAVAKCPRRFHDLDARLSALRLVCVIERHRLKLGKLPENLNELIPGSIPQLPLDPFNGEPFRFQRLSPGYVVYSVGPNLIDDNGNTLMKGGSSPDPGLRVTR